MEKEWIFNSATAEETCALAEQLGRLLQAGDSIFLIGDLGAGKTTFTQGLARGLDVPATTRVNSPTFAILQTYSGRLELYHIDLYRTERAEELDELGIDDLLQRRAGVTVIEWADRSTRYAAADHLVISMEVLETDARKFCARAYGRLAAERLRAWRQTTSRSDA